MVDAPQELLPVFAQPAVDVARGYPLRRVFVERAADGSGDLRLCVVLDGEASYAVRDATSHNGVASAFYRSWNRLRYGRTADVNYLTLHADGDVSSPDHAGDSQRWNRGDKGDVLGWFSLMRHYSRRVPRASWQRAAGGRPVVYMNTSNHLMGERNANPELEMHLWERYAVVEGGAAEAEAFARSLPVKPHLLCCCVLDCVRGRGSSSDAGAGAGAEELGDYEWR